MQAPSRFMPVPKPIKWIWNQIRGNAIWDFIKLGWTMIPGALVGFWSWLRTGKLWQVGGLFLVVCIVVFVIWWLVLRSKGQNRKLLIQIVDLIRSETYEPIGAMVKFSDQIGTERQTKWLCDELVKHKYEHPFSQLDHYSQNALQGKWLKFLQEARLRKNEVKSFINAYDFACTKWSGSEEFRKGIDKRRSRRSVVG